MLFKKYAPKSWKLFLLAVFFLSLEAVCDMLQPFYFAKLIDEGIASNNLSLIIHYGLTMVGIAFFGMANALMRNYISAHVSFSFGKHLREDLYEKVLSFSHDNMDKFDSGSLITRMTGDVNNLQFFLMMMMRVFLKAPILGIGSIILVAQLNKKLLLVYIIILPFIVLIVYLNMVIGYPLYSKIQKTVDKINHRTQEFLNGIRVVKAFNRFNYEKEKFHISNEELATTSEKAMKAMAIFPPLLTLTINGAIVYVLWQGEFLIASSEISVGGIVAFINYILKFLFAVMIISRIFTLFVKAKASILRVEEIFTTENTLQNPPRDIPTENLTIGAFKEIQFDNVSFNYGNGQETLKNISFTLTANQRIGIIGSTGSGKTTLANLIPRFYDVKSGQICIDGKNIKNFNLKDLRDLIGIIPQKSNLFTGSIRENLKWGNPKATDEEIAEVCHIAMVDDFVQKLPEGYNSRIGRGGVNLSGGQKQRLSIARALLKTPKLLILDDSTSAIDVLTEHSFKKNMKSYSNEMITLLIAQRITSVMDLDQIIVLGNGEIQGIGTHTFLMNNCTIYREVYESQLGKGVK